MTDARLLRAEELESAEVDGRCSVMGYLAELEWASMVICNDLIEG